MKHWEKKASYGGKKAIVNLGGIRGGHAWRASRTPEKTDLFLDVRVPPTIPMAEARRDIQQALLSIWKKRTPTGAWNSKPMSPFPARASAKTTR